MNVRCSHQSLRLLFPTNRARLSPPKNVSAGTPRCAALRGPRCKTSLENLLPGGALSSLIPDHPSFIVQFFSVLFHVNPLLILNYYCGICAKHPSKISCPEARSHHLFRIIRHFVVGYFRCFFAQIPCQYVNFCNMRSSTTHFPFLTQNRLCFFCTAERSRDLTC